MYVHMYVCQAILCHSHCMIQLQSCPFYDAVALLFWLSPPESGAVDCSSNNLLSNWYSGIQQTGPNNDSFFLLYSIKEYHRLLCYVRK